MEEDRAPPRHQCRPGGRMSADRALARHVGVAAFIVNNNPETMGAGPAIVSHSRRLVLWPRGFVRPALPFVPSPSRGRIYPTSADLKLPNSGKLEFGRTRAQ